MMYERSLEIGRRLDELLGLIRTGRYSTRTLAAKLRVSAPTISRDITALRQRGYEIRAVKGSRRWAYELISEPAMASPT
jgi:biotin operon repressor